MNCTTMEVGMITDASGEQACLSVWNLSNGVCLKSLKNGACAPNGVGFIDNYYVVCAQYQKQLLHVYDIYKEQLVRKIVCPGKITALTISPDGKYCIVALVEKIYVWQIATGNLLNILSKHYQAITLVKFTEDGSFFVSSGNDNLILVWNFANVLQPNDRFNDTDACDQPMHTLSQHSMPITSVYIGVGGMRSRVVSSSLDQTCKMYDLVSGKMLCSLVFDIACTAVTMDCTETRLFVGTSAGQIFIIMLCSEKQGFDSHMSSDDTPSIKAHSKSVTSLSVCMDSTKLLSGSHDNTVKLWHIVSKQCLRIFSFKGEITNAVALPLCKFVKEEKSNVSLPKIDIPNFKRNIYVPVENMTSWSDLDVKEEELLPVVLKDIDDDEKITDENRSSYFSQVMKECLLHQNKTSGGSLENESRFELIERITTLEAVAKDFYKFATEMLVDDGPNKNRMETE